MTQGTFISVTDSDPRKQQRTVPKVLYTAQYPKLFQILMKKKKKNISKYEL